jgi:hypothetical protein
MKRARIGLLFFVLIFIVSCTDKSTKSITINVTRCKVLSSFNTPEDKSNLLEYLSKNAVWRVSENRGVIAAERFCFDAKRAIREPYEIEGVSGQISCELYLGQIRFGGDAFPERISKIQADNASGGVIKYYRHGEYYLASGQITGSSIWLEIKEMVRTPDQGRFQIILDHVLDELVSVKSEIDNNIPVSQFRSMHEGSSIHVTDPNRVSMFDILPEAQQGIYIIKGYINEGVPGFLCIRLFDLNSNAEIDPDVNMLRNKEYVGWSEDVNERYYFQSTIIIPGNGMSNIQKKDVLLRLYFYPGERIVYERSLNLATWSR